MKAGAQNLYLKEMGHDLGNPCIYQRIFQDRKTGGCGARTHSVLSNGVDAVKWCYQNICSVKGPMGVMEIPWPEENDKGKLYVDWDAQLDEIGDGNMKMEDARELAMRLPSQLTQLMIRLGFFSPVDEIRVFYTEGTRKSKKDKWKISFHFIWDACMNYEDFLHVWNAILNDVKTVHPKLYYLITAKLPTENTGDLILQFPGYESFIGIDLAPIRNAKQGLAIIFSSKNVKDDCLRPLGIATFVSGCEVRWEIPCDDIYVGRGPETCTMKPTFKEKLMNSANPVKFNNSPETTRFKNSLDPVKVQEALANTSICICGPDCKEINVSPIDENRIIDKVKPPPSQNEDPLTLFDVFVDLCFVIGWINYTY